MALTWYRHFQRNGGLNQILRRKTSRFLLSDYILNFLFTSFHHLFALKDLYCFIFAMCTGVCEPVYSPVCLQRPNQYQCPGPRKFECPAFKRNGNYIYLRFLFHMHACDAVIVTTGTF
jgi:hypothetical protein